MAKKDIVTELSYDKENNKYLVFEKPEYKMTEFHEGNNYGKFELEPLERGFGLTLGNSLRRVLLSSLPGDAIIAVRIDGVLHEFQTIEGVIEDVTTIILNLKKMVVKKHVNDLMTIKVSAKGEKVITAGDLENLPNLEVVNKDQVICSLTNKGEINMEITVGRGRGYVLADEIKKTLPNIKVDTIPIDGLYSPIERVNTSVEKTRVGQDNSYDKLTIEIYTNGAIKPQEALNKAASILIAQLDKIDSPEFTETIKEKMQENVEDPKQKILETSIEELELSVRAHNCLKRIGINSVADLIDKTEDEISKVRNLGKKSLKEVVDKVKEMDLSFKDLEQ